MEPWKVVASNHAVERAFERCPVVRGASPRAAQRWVEQTATRALRDGRRAKRCPRWAVTGDERPKVKLRRDGPARYLWNEDLTTVFMVQCVKSVTAPGGRVWLVLTVWVKQARETA